MNKTVQQEIFHIKKRIAQKRVFITKKKRKMAEDDFDFDLEMMLDEPLRYKTGHSLKTVSL